MALVELPWRAVAGTSIDERIGREGGRYCVRSMRTKYTGGGSGVSPFASCTLAEQQIDVGHDRLGRP
jgi:hypothetical protein